MGRPVDPTTKRVWALPPLPERRPDSHKGDYGHVLAVAGSRGLGGAAALCAQAALRSGAGLVTCACPDSIWPQIAARVDCVMTAPLASDAEGGLAEAALPALRTLAAKASALCIGPGLGRGAGAVAVIRTLAADAKAPCILDADALRALSPVQPGNPAWTALRGRAVLAPHPGEMAGLLGIPVGKVQEDRRNAAKSLAGRLGVVVVLKGHGTVVTDGLRVAVNETGNPGMATAGSGDVLAGVLAGLLAQGMAPFEAARLGAHLHGLAGDLAAREKGQHSLIATDILESLPAAFLKQARA